MKKNKRILSLVLTLVMVFGLFGGMPVYAKDACGYSPAMTLSELADSGEQAVPGEAYSIKNTEEFLLFTDYVNSGANTTGAIFYLTADINFADTEWSPVGNNGYHAFEGIFDGCGFAVLNLHYEGRDSNVALFSYVSGEETVIKNLGVEGEITAGDNVAGIAADIDGAAIVNCWTAVDLTGDENVAGIAAAADNASILNCCSFGYINGEKNAAAIAGKLTGSSTVDYCYYVYYCADRACGSLSLGSSANVLRFSSSSTEVLTEKVLTVDSKETDDLLVLLNEWVNMQSNKDDYRDWIYDTSKSGTARTDGRYPSLKYPGYVQVLDSIYTPTATMSVLYELKENAQPGEYYSISTPREMQYFSEYVNNGFATAGATFFLTADIILDAGISTVDEINWTPIGMDDNTPFCGIFDGQGYILNGTIMYANDDLGLFGYIDNPGAIVKNVGVSSIINGDDRVGGICANLINGSIINCWYDGSITGDDRVGGIAGRVQNGKIYNCVDYANVTADREFGAICGEMNDASIVRYCYYANGNTTAIGEQRGTVSAVLSFSESGTDFDLERTVGIGSGASGKLLNALNLWVDLDAPDNTYRGWKIDPSSESIARIGGKHPTHLFPNDNSGLKHVDEPYRELDVEENPYNVYYAETATMTELYESGRSGLKGGHYSISTGEEMKLLADYVNGGSTTSDMVFYLTQDISVAEQCLGNDHDGWMPIGRDANITQPDTYLRSFQGTFDGCGYTVYNLYLSDNTADDAGLFGHIRNAEIKNLGVVGDIIAENKVGGIAATCNDSVIENCWAAVNIQAEDRIGGIAGRITDTVLHNCVSYGAMLAMGGSATAVAGGVFGVAESDSIVDHCYYLQSGICEPYEKADHPEDVKIVEFEYKYVNDQNMCVLKEAAVIEDMSSTNLLTALNQWVIAQNNGLYCGWYSSPDAIMVGITYGHFPKLMNPNVGESGENQDYKGDYKATSTMTELFSTRSDGIEGCCYSINGLADLEAFRSYVNSGFRTSGIIFFMTRDIDMSMTYSADTGRSWTPIGNVDEPFRGIFDGQGYTIKYMYINTTDEDQGLFGHITGTEAVVKNLGLCGSVICDNNAGGICGDFNFATIANCWVSCEVASLDGNAGGIVGGANAGSIINCTNYGVVANGKAFGAIAGYAVNTTMEYCYYLYMTCQKAYSGGSVVNEKGVMHFNGTSAACILDEKITVEGTETKNALAALKLYVDAHPETNYCYWAIGNTDEYLKMGVLYFPVLISSSGTIGNRDLNQVQAYFRGAEYYSVINAVNAANDYKTGGDVNLAVNAILSMHDNFTLDDNVRILTGDYSLVIKSVVKVRTMQQLNGVFILKDGGEIWLWDYDANDYKLFMYAEKNADASSNSAFYSPGSITFISKTVQGGKYESYDLALQDGELVVNSTLESGNPHKIPPKSTLTIMERGKLTVLPNARIRTTGEAVVNNNGSLQIGNVTLDRNGGVRMKGIFEDDGGKVTLPFIYRSGYTQRGWSDGNTTYLAGTKVRADKPITLTASWQLGDPTTDPYPGDDHYDDGDDPLHDIPITVIQSVGGQITPGSVMAARGENISFRFEPEDGYYIQSVLLDGKIVKLNENDRIYDLVSISSEHTIIALFSKTTNADYRNWHNPFTDMTEEDWFYNSVRYCSSANLFYGTSDTTFGPSGSMTREMIVTVLWRLSGKPVVPGEKCTFEDVSPNSYAYEAIRWGNYYNIVAGYSSSSFGYGIPISRQQLITFLFRYAKNYVGNDVSLYDGTNILQYSDVMQISKNMSQPFQWGLGAKIISGTSATTLSPRAIATRAQVASVFSRYCNLCIHEIPVISTK